MEIETYMTKRRSGKFIRFFLAITGLLLIKEFFSFISGYILGFHRIGKILVGDSYIEIKERKKLMGIKIGECTTIIPFDKIFYFQTDDSSSMLPVLGASLGLIIGILIGFIYLVEWSTTLLGIYIIIGFAFIISGILIDFIFLFLIPYFRKRMNFIIATKSEKFIFTGINNSQAEEINKILKEKTKAREK